jgi:hypothetical protein
MTSSNNRLTDRLKPVEPQDVDVPLSPVPDVVTVDSSDVDVASALFDRFCDDDENGYVGMLDAIVL